MRPLAHRKTARVLVTLAATAGLALMAAPAMADDDPAAPPAAGDPETPDPGTPDPGTPDPQTPTEVQKPATDTETTVTLMVGPSTVKTESKVGVQVTKPKTTTKAKPKATLPETGSSTAPLLGTAGALLLAGAAGVAVRRRQTS